jgi:hypothetical protein
LEAELKKQQSLNENQSKQINLQTALIQDFKVELASLKKDAQAEKE